MKLLAVLLLLVVGASAQDPHCCSYPLNVMQISLANVTGVIFDCSEPISFTCALPNFNNGIGLGVLGNSTAESNTVPSYYDIILTNFGYLTLDVVAKCNTENKLWFLEGFDGHYYEKFACAMKLNNGTYIAY